LWYQLSEKLLELNDIPFFGTGDHLLNLYNNFVNKIAKRIPPLDLVLLAITASTQITDVNGSLGFLDGVSKVVAGDEQAAVLVRMEMVRCNLRANKPAEAQSLLEDGKKRMDDYMGIMKALIHSHFYHASLLYAKSQGKHVEYYKNALLYLTYTPLTSIPQSEQLNLGKDISLAALLGETIYNFGELLQQPILKLLSSSNNQWSWLPELLLVFNRGDVEKFNSLVSDKKVFEPILTKHGDFLNEKIKIMAFMDMVLGRDAGKRKIEFKEISKRCDLKLNDVELMVMRAFSLKVVRGIIDQVDQSVRVKWVQPRVLETQQISVIRDRLKNWSKEIDETARYLEINAPELLQPFVH